jgi:hypothetical protein
MSTTRAWMACRAAAVALAAALGTLGGQVAVPPATQNPSPMVEHSRAHERIEPVDIPGLRRTFDGPLGKPVDVFVPVAAQRAAALHLVVVFHGAAFIPELAVSKLGYDHAVATLTLGAGSGVYGAGHGAVRAILRDPGHYRDVAAVLLLDGLHTSYVPEGQVVETGGVLDTTNLEAFVRFARAAMHGEKRFVITHSEIFPGTFASTTETTDFLIAQLGLRRTPVLRWGPGGMQQLSAVKSGGLEILGLPATRHRITSITSRACRSSFASPVLCACRNAKQATACGVRRAAWVAETSEAGARIIHAGLGRMYVLGSRVREPVRPT